MKKPTENKVRSKREYYECASCKAKSEKNCKECRKIRRAIDRDTNRMLFDDEATQFAKSDDELFREWLDSPGGEDSEFLKETN